MKLRLARKIQKRQYAGRWGTLDASNRRVRLERDRRPRAKCVNCDAEHDGVDWHPNHTGDIHCVYYEGI